MSSPFDDLLVLECATVLAGPAVGAFFAELGATVLKLEPPTGDVTRSWKLPSEHPAETVSAYFACVNWGKHSLALDLRQPAGRQIAQALAAKADILIANYKPGAAERLGMDYATLSALNPGLIYAHLTGYGDADPRTGYDAIIQAESGFLALNAHPGQLPVKMPVALIDLLAAHQLKQAVLVALLQRQHSGHGDYLQVSLIQSALASLANQASNWLVAGHEPQPLGLEHPNIAPYGGLYPCADGEQIMLAIGSDSQFATLCQLLSAPALATEFPSNAERVSRRVALNTALRPLIQAQAAQPLLAQLWQAGIPAGRMLTVSQALAQPAAHEMMLHSQELRGLRTSVFHSRPLTPVALRPPPPLGADGPEVLAHWLQLTPNQIAEFQATGVLRTSPSNAS